MASTSTPIGRGLNYLVDRLVLLKRFFSPKADPKKVLDAALPAIRHNAFQYNNLTLGIHGHGAPPVVLSVTPNTPILANSPSSASTEEKGSSSKEQNGRLPNEADVNTNYMSLDGSALDEVSRTSYSIWCCCTPDKKTPLASQDVLTAHLHNSSPAATLPRAPSVEKKSTNNSNSDDRNALPDRLSSPLVQDTLLSPSNKSASTANPLPVASPEMQGFENYAPQIQNALIEEIVTVEKYYISFSRDSNETFIHEDSLDVKNLGQYIFLKDHLFLDFEEGKQTPVSVSISTFNTEKLQFVKKYQKKSSIDQLGSLFKELESMNDRGPISLKRISQIS